MPAGKVNKSTVLSAVVWLPTVCAAASVRLSDGYAPDGENMLPTLLGKDVQRAKPIFWDWRGNETPKECWPRWAVRDGDWKLLSDGEGRVELYNSPDGWAEAENIASQHPEIVAKLSTQLKAWRATLPRQPAADNMSREGRPKRPDRGKTKQRGDGRNSPPKEHLAAAIREAQSIQPLNANGEPAPDGKIVLISNGASDTQPEFDTLIEMLSDVPEVNPQLVLVNTAQGGQEAGDWAFPERRVAKGKQNPWEVQTTKLQQAGVLLPEQFTGRHAARTAAPTSM